MSNIVLGRQIRAARILAGLTQADLARAAGCHPRQGCDCSKVKFLFAPEGQIITLFL
jgi:transcriptional regulator with XRE-family HTH domain